MTVVGAPFAAFPADDPPTVERGPVGSTEAAVEAEIDDLAVRAGIWTPECARLESQAMAAAKIVDGLIGNGKVHLIPAHYRLVSQAMAELKAILRPVPAFGSGSDAFEDEADEFTVGFGQGLSYEESHRDHLPWTYPPDKVNETKP